MPGLVRRVADVPGEQAVNPEQVAAVEAEGEVFVSAGAGTGKTSVLVERFVRAVCDEGLDVESSLVITYTGRELLTAHSERRRSPRPEGRRVPGLVRRLAHVPGG